MLSDRKRFFYFGNVEITKRASDAPLPTIHDVLERIRLVFDNNEALEIKGEPPNAVATRLADMRVADGYAALLFQYTDMALTPTSLQDLQSAQIRSVKKRDGEGVAYSSHVLIALDPIKEGVYPALREEVPHLSRSRVDPFLRKLLNSGEPFEYQKTPRSKAVPFQVGIRYSVEPDEEFVTQLEEGRLELIRLVKKVKKGVAGINEKGVFTEQKRVVYLKPEPESRVGDPARKAIERALTRAKKDKYDDVVVSYIRGAKRRSTTIDKAIDLEDVLAGKFVEVDFDKNLEPCRADFDEIVLKRMMAELES